MPWRLIQFIVLFAILLLFVVFNLENKCNISFGLTKATDVPVFLTAFVAFFAGMLCTLPFVLGSRARKKEKNNQGGGLLDKASRKKGKDTGVPSGDASLPDSRHYGID